MFLEKTITGVSHLQPDEPTQQQLARSPHIRTGMPHFHKVIDIDGEHVATVKLSRSGADRDHEAEMDVYAVASDGGIEQRDLLPSHVDAGKTLTLKPTHSTTPDVTRHVIRRVAAMYPHLKTVYGTRVTGVAKARSAPEVVHFNLDQARGRKVSEKHITGVWIEPDENTRGHLNRGDGMWRDGVEHNHNVFDQDGEHVAQLTLKNYIHSTRSAEMDVHAIAKRTDWRGYSWSVPTISPTHTAGADVTRRALKYVADTYPNLKSVRGERKTGTSAAYHGGREVVHFDLDKSRTRKFEDHMEEVRKKTFKVMPEHGLMIQMLQDHGFVPYGKPNNNRDSSSFGTTSMHHYGTHDTVEVHHRDHDKPANAYGSGYRIAAAGKFTFHPSTSYNAAHTRVPRKSVKMMRDDPDTTSSPTPEEPPEHAGMMALAAPNHPDLQKWARQATAPEESVTGHGSEQLRAALHKFGHRGKFESVTPQYSTFQVASGADPSLVLASLLR